MRPGRLDDCFLVVSWVESLRAGVTPFTPDVGADYPPWALVTLAPLAWLSDVLPPDFVALVWIGLNLALSGLVVSLSSLYPIIRSTIDVVIWLAAAWLCGVSLAQANFIGATVVFAAGAVAMAGFGFVSAAFAVVFKRGDPVLWLFGAMSFLLGGVLYPTDILPPVLAALSQALPATHALNAMRAVLLDGASLREVAPQLASLVAFGVIGGAIQMARERGSLGHG